MAKEYSAGAVSKGFWFQQFKKYIELLNIGKTEREIRELQKSQNILLSPSEAYGVKMLGAAAKRSKALPKEMIEIFQSLNIGDQKILNLLGILMTDKLLFEFLYEVYRDEINKGSEILEDKEFRIFFKNKSEQSEEVDGFKDYTKTRLAGAYKTYMREANLLTEKNKSDYITRPVLDTRLEDLMKESGLEVYLKAITGDI